MTWSFSEGRTFKNCPRRWFYKSVFAESRSKDPLRREAYLLSKLQSIYAWRGQIVDTVLSHDVVAGLNAKRPPKLNAVLLKARQLFDAQKDFGLRHRIRDPKSDSPEDKTAFAAFFNVEYGIPLADNDFQRAWEDIELAIRNLWAMQALRSQLREGRYFVAQRTLQFKFCDTTVRALPDLIVFHSEKSPMIVDWKVHTFATRDYADQLATYALALTRATPHIDFPQFSRRSPSDVRLVEVQLVLGATRYHELSQDEFSYAEEHIADSMSAIQHAIDGRKLSDLRVEDFPTARNPQSCQNCPFKKICWSKGL